jgi:hypothetical protein
MHTLNPFATASLGALLLLLAGCPSDDEFTQLNQDGDCVRVTIEPVTAGDDDDAADDDDSTADDDDSAAADDDDSAADDDDSAGDDDDATDPANSTNLVPLPGFFGLDVIGTATVDPASGPAGTELTFTIVAILEDTGETSGNPIDAVDRAVVRVNNGSVEGTSNDITLDEWEMTKSAADARRWRLELRAGGDSSTTRRTDELCIVLFAQNE